MGTSFQKKNLDFLEREICCEVPDAPGGKGRGRRALQHPGVRIREPGTCLIPPGFCGNGGMREKIPVGQERGCNSHSRPGSCRNSTEHGGILLRKGLISTRRIESFQRHIQTSSHTLKPPHPSKMVPSGGLKTPNLPGVKTQHKGFPSTCPLCRFIGSFTQKHLLPLTPFPLGGGWGPC